MRNQGLLTYEIDGWMSEGNVLPCWRTERNMFQYEQALRGLPIRYPGLEHMEYDEDHQVRSFDKLRILDGSSELM